MSAKTIYRRNGLVQSIRIWADDREVAQGTLGTTGRVLGCHDRLPAGVPEAIQAAIADESCDSIDHDGVTYGWMISNGECLGEYGTTRGGYIVYASPGHEDRARRLWGRLDHVDGMEADEILAELVRIGCAVRE